jgi:hypothetical protein
LDGKQCASAKINIYPTKRECSVQREPMKVSYENGTNTYTGMVYAHGYNEKDELAYRCFGQPYRIKLGSIPGFSDFEYEIKCQSSSKLAEPVRVSIGNEECGLLFPPN